jgi:hypothetical protein
MAVVLKVHLVPSLLGFVPKPLSFMCQKIFIQAENVVTASG